MGTSQDNRKFSRVDFRITANVVVGDKKITGKVENMSLRGLFLLTDQQLSVGDLAEVTIALNDDPENGLMLDGKVVRVTTDGIALLFEKIDLDSYLHLRNLIAFNTGDAGRVDEEFLSFLDDPPTLSQG